MLLITRREGEALVVNGTIEVKVLEIRGGRVKLGIEYPAGNTVFRQELFAKIQAENRAAALPPTDTARMQAALGQVGARQVGANLKVGTEAAKKEGNQKGPTHDDLDDDSGNDE